MEKADKILAEISELFPNARCELNYNNIFELLISVMLSAQTTDKAVNKVTPILFDRYKTIEQLKDANINDIILIIKPLGLSTTKAKNIINIAKSVVEDYHGTVPNSKEQLMSLPGVGRKTANVILSEGFNIPSIAVDTHVLRVANRLGLSSYKDTYKVEEDLMKLYPKDLYHDVHHKLLFFGRYLCKAKNPQCSICPFVKSCKK